MNKTIEELRNLALELQPIIDAKIKSLLDTFYKKPYEEESRIKSENGLLRKQEKIPEYYKDNISKIPDVLGFRISLPSDEDCPFVAKLIEEFLKPHTLFDMFNNPKPTGFKAFLYHISTEKVNIEIQIMTYQMRDWTNATHAEHEMRKYGSVLSDNTQEERKI